MSTAIMPTLASTSPAKARKTVVMDYSKKQAIDEIAKRQNRTPHYIILEMIDKGIKEAQEEAEYQEYIKNRVMSAYNDMLENGTKGVNSRELKQMVMQSLDERLNAK